MLARIINELRMLRKWFRLGRCGYLLDHGWFASIRNGGSVDRDNKPSLWMTYPFIDFIEERLSGNLRVFEYGSGNSTIYLEGRVSEIYSVEHDRSWYDSIRSKLANNEHLLFRDVNDVRQYVSAIDDPGGLYDIVLVDGRHRSECLRYAVNFLTPQGVIVLDDAERDEYADAIAQLLVAGFRRLDFYGIASGILYKKDTCILYRSNNCLSI